MTHLNLKHYRGDEIVRGAILSNDRYCAQGPVDIYRREDGPDKALFEMTAAGGYFKFGANGLEPGVYYAKVARRKLDYGYCPEVASKPRRLDTAAFHGVQPARIGLYRDTYGQYLFLNARYGGKQNIAVIRAPRHPNAYLIRDSHRMIPDTRGCRSVNPKLVRCKTPESGLVVWGSDRRRNRIDVTFGGYVLVAAGGAADQVTVHAADTEIFLGDGDDSYRGSAGTDSVWGFEGADVIRSFDGEDWIYGNRGRDTLVAGDGDDRVAAHSGDADLLVSCGQGRDQAFRDRGLDPQLQSCEDVSGRHDRPLPSARARALRPPSDE
jgi:Ca2+-binding RTX toxin-like protein